MNKSDFFDSVIEWLAGPLRRGSPMEAVRRGRVQRRKPWTLLRISVDVLFHFRLRTRNCLRVQCWCRDAKVQRWGAAVYAGWSGGLGEWPGTMPTLLCETKSHATILTVYRHLVPASGRRTHHPRDMAEFRRWAWVASRKERPIAGGWAIHVHIIAQSANGMTCLAFHYAAAATNENPESRMCPTRPTTTKLHLHKKSSS
jgi:hypothetical protein